MTTFTPSDVSRGTCSMQSTGQKGTQASHPVQLSGMTTAISFGFFFLRVIFTGASGMIIVGFAFFASYAIDISALLVRLADPLYPESRGYVRWFPQSDYWASMPPP